VKVAVLAVTRLYPVEWDTN